MPSPGVRWTPDRFRARPDRSDSPVHGRRRSRSGRRPTPSLFDPYPKETPVAETPIFQSLMDQARAAAAELDAALADAERAVAAALELVQQRRGLVAELSEKRRQIGAILGERRPAGRPKAPKAVVDGLAAAGAVHACECGKTFEKAQGLSMHRTRAGHHTAGAPSAAAPARAAAPVAPVPSPAEIEAASSALYSPFEADLLRMWREQERAHPRGVDVKRTCELIADATGKRPEVVRTTAEQLGLVAA